MAELARHFEAMGFLKLHVFLDQNTTHKAKMKNLFHQKTETMGIQTCFHHFAPYSPKLNVAEYAIHLARLKILHHADYKTPLQQFQNLIQNLCDHQQLLNPHQIVNILCHIENLIPKNQNFSPERE